MVRRTDIRVTLTPDLAAFVQERVSSGRFQTEGEAIREALRLLEVRERELDSARQNLKTKLQRGIQQADNGELVDGEKFMKWLRTKIERQRKTSAA